MILHDVQIWYKEQCQALSEDFGITAQTADHYVRENLADPERTLADVAEQAFRQHGKPWPEEYQPKCLSDIVAYGAGDYVIGQQVFRQAESECFSLIKSYDHDDDTIQHAIDMLYKCWWLKREYDYLDDDYSRTDEDWQQRPLEQPEVQAYLGKQALICVCASMGMELQDLHENKRRALLIRNEQDGCERPSGLSGIMSYMTAAMQKMQEGMQALTASQRDDTLGEGLKQGGRVRH